VPSLRALLRSRAAVIAGMAYLVVALICTQVPLFNYLGFESSFVTALAGSLIASALTVSLLRPSYRASDPVVRPFPVFRFSGTTITLQLVLLALPLAVFSGNALFVPNCDFAEGLAFFILLPVVAVLFSTALAIFCVVHYRRPRTVFLLYAAASFLYVLLLGYFTPAVFSYNFFYGYFPGLTYDELLPLGWPLVTFRLVTAGIAITLLWLAQLIVNNTTPTTRTTVKGVTLLRLLGTRYWHVTGILLVVATGLYVYRCPLGWESTRAFVQSRLGGVVKTANFTIYYDTAATTPDDLRNLVLEHEFRLHQVREAFALQRTDRITSYVYPTVAAKRRLIGAGETELAKPWSGEVHITRSSADDVLKHELVHVVAAPFGMPVLHASLSPGLTEGLAVAVEGNWGYRTLAQYAAAIRAAGISPPVRSLMTPAGFMTASSSVSYVLAGAFCQFLVERYGMRALVQAYRTGDYEGAYDAPLDSLLARWQRSLDSVAVTPADRASVDVLFRRPPIFGKVCARVHARRLRDARLLLQDHRYDEALARYVQLYAEGGSIDALSGLLTVRFRMGEYNDVVHLYDSVTAHDPVPRHYLGLGLTVGDALWAEGNIHRAESLYAAVRNASISPGMTEASVIRLWALSDTVARTRLCRYFTTEMSDTERIGWLAASDNAVPDRLWEYLRGRVALRLRWYGGAAVLLENVGCIEQDSTAEALRQVAIGDALCRMGRPQEARGWYWTSLNFNAQPYAMSVVNDRLSRCDWLTAIQARMR
jgi:hypothetical protein